MRLGDEVPGKAWKLIEEVATGKYEHKPHLWKRSGPVAPVRPLVQKARERRDADA